MPMIGNPGSSSKMASVRSRIAFRRKYAEGRRDSTTSARQGGVATTRRCFPDRMPLPVADMAMLLNRLA